MDFKGRGSSEIDVDHRWSMRSRAMQAEERRSGFEKLFLRNGINKEMLPISKLRKLCEVFGLEKEAPLGRSSGFKSLLASNYPVVFIPAKDLGSSIVIIFIEFPMFQVVQILGLKNENALIIPLLTKAVHFIVFK